MRNILKGYHEIIAISVTLSAGTGGTATFTPAALGPAYSLSSLPIGTQIQLVQIEGVDTYVFLHNGSEIGTLTTTPSSGYKLSGVIVNSTPVSSTAITLSDGDIINVAFSLSEILLAHSPDYGGYEMLWDGVDSIGFRFQSVQGYSGEIWMADTDYGMPTLNQMGLYPDIVPTMQDKETMSQNGGENLYIPGNLTVQNVYQNGSWQGTVDLSTYDGTPSQAWTNAHFVGTTEWNIICDMLLNTNLWELPDGTPFTDFVGAQIPGTVINISAFNLVSYREGGTYKITTGDGLGYIPGDYNLLAGSYDYRSGVIRYQTPFAIPYWAPMQYDILNTNKDISLGKMRVLNTTKTNYSLVS